ncbi:hypothetical protein STANM309S_00699 [Streptomyces tanashiensis]
MTEEARHGHRQREPRETGETLRTYEAHGPEEVERRVAAAH